jgi:hypothetical protein
LADVDLAPTGEDGRVRFRGDAHLLVPATDPRGGVLVVAANRGMLLGLGTRERALLGRGWTIAWCGWQWDVVRGPDRVGLDVPDAMADGGAVHAPVRIDIAPDGVVADHPLADTPPLARNDPSADGHAFHRYPAADLDDPDAVLTVRDGWDAPRRTVPRDRWRFARELEGEVVPDDEHVWLEGGFRPGRHYELCFASRRAPISSLGLLAFRDLGAFLRAGGHDGEPLAHAIAHGGSQSGRFLRTWLAEGLNLDEQGRRVYDGLFVGVAGGRRSEVNHRGAQPALMYPGGFSTRPPFATDDLLARQRDRGGVPLVVSTNAAWEYWVGDAALTHTVEGRKDRPDSPHTRTYLVAGVDHIGPHLELKRVLPLAHEPNPLSSTLVSAAAFAHLVAWVVDGVEPPPSEVPRLADASAATRSEVLDRFPAVPGAVHPVAEGMMWLRSVDLGPDADRGIPRWPAVFGEALPDLVSAVDGDGNEVAGVRLPEIAVPVGTFTGWNPRRPDDELPVSLYARCGSFWPFARTERERALSGDPRPSLESRYRDRVDYENQARLAAGALVEARHLLAQDLDAAVAAAVALYDRVAGRPDDPTGTGVSP